MRRSDWSADGCASDRLPFWFCEGDLPPAESFSKAAIAALRDGQTVYLCQRCIPPLRQALSDYLGRLYGVSVPVDRITVTSSGMQVIMLAMQALIGVGDELVVVSPVWPNIFSAAEIMGGVVRPVPRSEEHTSELQSLMRISYAVFCLKTKNN